MRVTIRDLCVEADLTRQEQQETLGGYILAYIEQENVYKGSQHSLLGSQSDSRSTGSTGGANFVLADGSVRF